MARRMSSVLGLVIGVMACVVGASLAGAQDPLEVGKDIYTKRFENDRVRVSSIHFKPDAAIPMHSHPDHFLYVVKAGKVRLSYPDGTSKEVDGKVHDVMWIPAESHSAVNVGGTDFEAIVVELKK